MSVLKVSRRQLLRGGAYLGLTSLAAPSIIKRASAAEELVMGTITPHTGPYGYAGKQVIEGAKLAIDMHGGEVTADSAGPGEGSTFSIILPSSNEA